MRCHLSDHFGKLHCSDNMKFCSTQCGVNVFTSDYCMCLNCLTDQFKALLDETTIFVICRCCWWVAVDILTSGLFPEGEWNPKRSPVSLQLEKCVKRLVSYMLYFYTVKLLFFLTEWATPQRLRCIQIQNLCLKCAVFWSLFVPRNFAIRMGFQLKDGPSDVLCYISPNSSVFNSGPNTMLSKPISSMKSSTSNGQWERERT